jgi:hypothetical protein
MSDQVRSPLHYNTGKIEVIEFLEDQKLNFHRANAVKYITRAGRKSPEKEIEDLEKAAWYINRDIELLKSQKEKREPIRPNDMTTQKGEAQKWKDEKTGFTWEYYYNRVNWDEANSAFCLMLPNFTELQTAIDNGLLRFINLGKEAHAPDLILWTTTEAQLYAGGPFDSAKAYSVKRLSMITASKNIRAAMLWVYRS